MKWSLFKSRFLTEIKKKNPLKNPKKRKKIWRAVLIYSGYAVLGLIFITAIAFAWFSKDLPTPSKIASMKPAVSTKLYDRTGTILLYETGDQKRTIVTSDQISSYIKEATVSTEDANFYNHHGVDAVAIMKAVGDKLLGRTAVLRGGSTITQQYVKNSFLTSDRSVVRKIKEAILSVELEFMYNKDQILTMYLNEIPYGNAAAGAEAAAQNYYGVSAKNLTLSEAATLAAMPQAPTYYSPYGTHLDSLIARKNYVLDQMVKNKKISADDAAKAKAEDTTTIGKELRARRDSILTPHFAMYVLEQVANQYGESAIQKQGLTIITTLDYGKQQIAQTAIDNGVPKLAKYGGSNAALVAVDPKTGQILSMIGSKDYFDTSIDGNVNVADSLRQPGSSFKPIAYATAFKQPDFSPSRILFDLTTDFGSYTPHDYDNKNRGPVTMRQALANSLNIPAVKIMGLAGIDNVLRTASDMGITTLTQRDRYGLSLVLGSGEVKPIQMAGAFSVFATGGNETATTPLLKVTDSTGKVLYDFDRDHKASQQVLDPQIAYEISSILTDNNARSLVFGTHTQLYFPDRTVAVKTGTTSDFKDAWTVGYTPSIAVAVWTGNSNAKAMSSGADGSVVAAPIFHEFIVNALKGTPNEDFAKPDGIQTVTVEKYSNKLPSQYSTETTTDIFATWQVPKDQDNIHKIVRLCKGTTLLAPDGTADDLVDQKTVVDLHSEKPSDPNWENPVLAWAQASGMGGFSPTGSCDVSTITPTIAFTSPADGAALSGQTDLTVSIHSPNDITKVEYFVDGVSVGTGASAPFGGSFDFSTLAEGSHKLSAVVTDSKNLTASAEISITSADKTGPQISQVASTPKPTSAVIIWITNKSSDSSVTYHPDGTSADSSVSDPIMALSHQISLSNLTPNKKYDFTITSKDSSGNSTTSIEYNFTTPLNDEPIILPKK